MTLTIIVAAGLGAMVLVMVAGRLLNRTPTTAPPTLSPPPQEPARPASSPDLDLPDPPGSERRQAPRRKGSSVSVLINDTQHSESLSGWIVDRSTTGLCLEVDQPLEPGAIIQVKPAQAPEATAWVPADVKYCRPYGSVYHVGCHFLRTPPWNVLLLFG